MEAFIRLWETTESGFIKYFKTYYASRAGYTLRCIYLLYHVHVRLCRVAACITHVQRRVAVMWYYYDYTEKWALCYRAFDHGDTDTNMYVER